MKIICLFWYNWNHCKFKNDIALATDINIAKELTGINDLIYVYVHGKLKILNYILIM